VREKGTRVCDDPARLHTETVSEMPSCGHTRPHQPLQSHTTHQNRHEFLNLAATFFFLQQIMCFTHLFMQPSSPSPASASV
jgi:hypothetical protein